MAVQIAFLGNEEIRKRAEDFLAKYHPTGDIPVPIVDIVEFDLGIEMFPLPSAEKIFGFMAALSSDLKTIVYDENSDRKHPPRFRYTLAHEIGHLVLHSELIQSLDLTSKESWKKAISEIDPKMYSRIESQAYVFAEYVLVPTEPLIAAFNRAGQKAQANGIDLREAGESAVSIVAGSIAKEFNVSTAVIEHRICREGLQF